MAITAGRFLVKLRDPTAPATLHLSTRFGTEGSEVVLDTEPLFRSVNVRGLRGLSANMGEWRLARARTGLDEAQAWATCHQLARDSNIEVAEPDLAGC
jgi:hypothetical protein